MFGVLVSGLGVWSLWVKISRLIFLFLGFWFLVWSFDFGILSWVFGLGICSLEFGVCNLGVWDIEFAILGM